MLLLAILTLKSALTAVRYETRVKPMTQHVFTFETKALDDDDWTRVSDDEFMEALYKSYSKCTPVIKQMLAGQEVHIKGVAYRIRAEKV